jgi:hypothetical protein
VPFSSAKSFRIKTRCVNIISSALTCRSPRILGAPWLSTHFPSGYSTASESTNVLGWSAGRFAKHSPFLYEKFAELIGRPDGRQRRRPAARASGLARHRSSQGRNDVPSRIQ